MSTRSASASDLSEAAFNVRIPGELLVPGGDGRLRTQLIGLLEASERRAVGVHVGMWLSGSGDERFVVRDSHNGGHWRELCSIPVRGNTGETFGALSISVDNGRVISEQELGAVEAVAWMAGLLVECAEAIEYRSLLDRVPSAIYIADTGEEGRWRYVSAKIEAILGFTAEEWSADPTLWARQLHPEDRERVLALEPDEEFNAWGDPLPHEYRMLHRDGHTVWVRDDALLVHDELGRGRWHGVLLDITDRKLAEAASERSAAQHAAVARLGEHALERVAIGDLMQEAVSTVTEMLGVDGAVIAELTSGGDSFELRAVCGEPRLGLDGRLVAGGVSAQAAQTVLVGDPVVVPDWATEERFKRQEITGEGDVRSTLTVLIGDRERRYGVLASYAVGPRDYSPADIDFVQSLANVLGDALERQSTEDAIQHRALHDPLTGLPNRVLFLDRLEHALARLARQRAARAAVLFVDLDNFKLVNDSLGHQVGDELLAAVAARLRQAIRPSDTVARFGGDEFGLLLEEVSNERGAIAMAQRLATVLARPFELEASEHFVTASVGIALAEGGEQAADLIRDADAAMYRAKERGRARYELYDEVMRGRGIARLRVENDLRRALDRQELRLAYQPVVSLRDELIVGVEALVRWQHPERGLILPDEFVPIAEDSGLIERIGGWVLESACQQGARWAAAAPDAAPIGISVNLSPIQLAQRTCVERVARVLHRTGLDPSLLSLEITETTLVSKADAIGEALRALKELGVRLVLDDFGTGYSSLGYLTRLPLDALKIEREFVHALGTDRSDHAITEAIIAMARALSLQVVGEGVETDGQVAELRRLRCDFAQGFYFSTPLTARQMTAVLQRGMKLARRRDGTGDPRSHRAIAASRSAPRVPDRRNLKQI
jgi:diguanylate cyclase (GGDEF)-like protein/PAS domain S-box-containing protein